MRDLKSEQKPGRVAIENVNHLAQTSDVDAGMYHAVRDALLKVLPSDAPGLTQAQFQEAIGPHLPDDLFPGGARSGWWSKAVQLDLEAKGLIVRKSTTPLRWHRSRV